MAVENTAAESLFRAGRYLEVLREDAPDSKASHCADVSQQLRAAQALIHGERLTEARRLILAHISDRDAAVRARCELLLGMLAKRELGPEDARRHFQSAIRLATDAGATAVAAWAHLRLFRLLAERDSHQELCALLAEARRFVIRAGDAHLAAYLHESVALREAQTGGLNEAKRHLAAASLLLQRDPNAWIEQLIHMSSACVAGLDCDFTTALRESQSARELRSTTGPSYQDPIIDVNESHFELWTGRLKSASAKLRKAALHRRPSIRIPAIDGLARIHLLLNQLPECEALLGALNSDLGTDQSSFYSYRWVVCTQLDFLLRKGVASEVVRLADPEIDKAKRISDVRLVIALLLLKANALAHIGSRVDCGLTLLEAATLGGLDYREQLGAFYDACRRAVHEDDEPLALSLFRRAQRVWRAQGNISAQIRSAQTSGKALELRNYSQQDVDALNGMETQMHLTGIIETSHFVLNSIAAAFDLAEEPSLSIQELQNVANIVGCGKLITWVPADDTGNVTNLIRPLTIDGGASGTQTVRPRDGILIADLLRIAKAVSTVAIAREERRQRTALWPAEELNASDSFFVSDEMRTTADTARRVALTNVPVLITGETGTGKEVLARAIHAASPRTKAPFVPFNCAAGPKDMIDAQLFGHRRGAFTGATEHALGVFRAAAGGTLLLDEIGESPLDVQPKLLRFLDSGEIHPVGEPLPMKVDVRVIAATNVDLDAAVSGGHFREDLFYRLNIVRLHLPPLRERRSEIPVFAQQYLRRFAQETGKGHLRLAEETMEYLLLYRWPGNVRQLSNEMRRLAALAEADAILMPEHLSPDIVQSRRTIPPSERALEPNEVVVRLDQPLAAATEYLERTIIPYALKLSANRVEEAAHRLGLSRKGLYLKRLRLGLEMPVNHQKSA